MTKKRQEQTPEYAMTRCLEYVPSVTLGAAIGKSHHLVDKMSDPDEDRNIPVSYALIFDRLTYRAAGVAPFKDLFLQNHSEIETVAGNIKEHVVRTTAALGQLAAVVMAALAKDSEDGTGVGSRELQEILIAAEGIESDLNKLKQVTLAASMKHAAKISSK